MAVAALVGSAASSAQASPWTTPHFAGEHGHATAANSSAIFYNPAALGLSPGHRVLVDTTASLRWHRYDRPAAGPQDVQPGQAPVQDSQQTLQQFGHANDGRAHGFTPAAIPFVGVHSDLGTERFTLGAAFYVPFDSAVRWEGNPPFLGDPLAPSAADGVARWHAIENRVVSRAVSLGMAFTFRRIGLSMGVTATAMHTRIDHRFARTAAGTDDILGPMGMPTEGRRTLSAQGWQGSFTVGAVYDVAARGRAWLGLAYTSQANVRGGIRLGGTLGYADATGARSERTVDVWQTMPDVLRASVRVRPTERVELRVQADWVRWSVFDHQCITEAGRKQDPCSEGGDLLASPETYGANEDWTGVLEFIPRAWQDTITTRLGASFWIRPQLESFISLGFESRAAPRETLDASFVQTHVIAPAIGFRWQIVEAFAIATTWTERIGLPQSTQGRSQLNRYPLPLRRPSGDGVYRQFTQLFNLYAELSF